MRTTTATRLMLALLAATALLTGCSAALKNQVCALLPPLYAPFCPQTLSAGLELQKETPKWESDISAPSSPTSRP